jgi:hypothetical protein
MTKQSLVICHNAVASIPAKNSEQATALAQCLAELENEIQKIDRGANVVVMEPKKESGPGSPEARRRRAANRSKAAQAPAAPTEPAEK